MEGKNGILMKAKPWLIIVFSFLSLGVLPPTLGWAGILLGIIILIERRWPEKWGDDKKMENSVVK